LAAGPTTQLGGVLTQNTGVTFGGASNFALSFGDNVGPGPSANVSLGNTAGINAAQTANAQFGGSLSAPIRVVTANYTIANDDYTVLCNNAANAAPVVISPPAAAASNKGRVYIIKRVNPTTTGTNDNCEVANLRGAAGNVVLYGPGTLTTYQTGVTIQSDGTGWWIVGSIMGTIPPAGVEDVATGAITVNSSVYTKVLGGPSVDVLIPPSGKVLVILTGELNGDNNNSTAFMSVSFGDDPLALDTNALRVTGTNPVRASITALVTLPTFIGQTITVYANYKRVGTGLATFNARQLTVIPQ